MTQTNFTIRQKETGKLICDLSVDGQGLHVKEGNPEDFIGPDHLQGAVGNILGGIRGAFGLVEYGLDDDGQLSRKDEFLIPGEDPEERIVASVRTYLGVLSQIYDIEEQVGG